MAVVKIAAGAEIDIATGDELKQGVGKILGAMPSDPRPIYSFRTDTEIGTGSTMVIDLGSPPVGSIWQLRYVTLFGNDDNTTVAGVTMGLYCGNPTQLSLAQLKIPGLAVCSFTVIPDTCIWCHPNENLVLRSSGVVNLGQQIGGIIGVEEWLQRDVSRLGGAP